MPSTVRINIEGSCCLPSTSLCSSLTVSSPKPRLCTGETLRPRNLERLTPGLPAIRRACWDLNPGFLTSLGTFSSPSYSPSGVQLTLGIGALSKLRRLPLTHSSAAGPSPPAGRLPEEEQRDRLGRGCHILQGCWAGAQVSPLCVIGPGEASQMSQHPQPWEGANVSPETQTPLLLRTPLPRVHTAHLPSHPLSRFADLISSQLRFTFSKST